MRSNRILKENRQRTGPVRKSVVGCWSPEEDEVLRRSVRKYGAKNWKKISELVPNRTNIQCLHRWQKVLNPSLVKGPWSSEEDRNLKKLCSKLGTSNWPAISSQVNGRNSKQCRERWYNHLAPNIKRSPWTDEEEGILMSNQKKLGNKWSQISKLIEGRTQNACKNQYHKIMNRRRREQKSTNSRNLGEIPSNSSGRITRSRRQKNSPNQSAGSTRKRRKRKKSSPRITKRVTRSSVARNRNQGKKVETNNLDLHPPFPEIGKADRLGEGRYVGRAEPMDRVYPSPQSSTSSSIDTSLNNPNVNNTMSSSFLPISQQDLTPEVVRSGSNNNVRGHVNQVLPNHMYSPVIPKMVDSSPNNVPLPSMIGHQRNMIVKNTSNMTNMTTKLQIPQIPISTKPEMKPISGGENNNNSEVDALDGNVLFRDIQRRCLLREYQQLLFKQQMQRQQFFANISNNDTGEPGINKGESWSDDSKRM